MHTTVLISLSCFWMLESSEGLYAVFTHCRNQVFLLLLSILYTLPSGAQPFCLISWMMGDIWSVYGSEPAGGPDLVHGMSMVEMMWLCREEQRAVWTWWSCTGEGGMALLYVAKFPNLWWVPDTRCHSSVAGYGPGPGAECPCTRPCCL